MEVVDTLHFLRKQHIVTPSMVKFCDLKLFKSLPPSVITLCYNNTIPIIPTPSQPHPSHLSHHNHTHPISIRPIKSQAQSHLHHTDHIYITPISSPPYHPIANSCPSHPSNLQVEHPVNVSIILIPSLPHHSIYLIYTTPILPPWQNATIIFYIHCLMPGAS